MKAIRAPIIFLNGTSSSGKTSIAKAFQKLYREPCLYVSVDAFIFMLADHVRKNDAVRKQALPPVISAFHKSLKHLAECGLPMIIDHVIELEKWAQECANILARYQAYFVAVQCPLEVLEARELARGDREIGLAKWQLSRVHTFGAYDFELDSSTNTPEQNAKILLELLQANRTPSAFRQIKAEAIDAAGNQS